MYCSIRRDFTWPRLEVDTVDTLHVRPLSVSKTHLYLLNMYMQCGSGPYIAGTRADEGDTLGRHPHAAGSQDEGAIGRSSHQG
jgi:hypothetical protein